MAASVVGPAASTARAPAASWRAREVPVRQHAVHVPLREPSVTCHCCAFVAPSSSLCDTRCTAAP